MNCPICKHPDLTVAIPSCPTCGSDIEIFSIINKLDLQIKKLKQTRMALLITFCLGVLLLAFAYTRHKGKTEIILNQQTKINYLKQKDSVHQANINELKKQLEEKEIQKQTQTTVTVAKKEISPDARRIVKKGETLWVIAKKELGNGFKYDKIAKDNNLQNPDKLIIGTELKIKK